MVRFLRNFGKTMFVKIVDINFLHLINFMKFKGPNVPPVKKLFF